jgi:DeoR family myo-inositol catabolism operon transcriptional repressor
MTYCELEEIDTFITDKLPPKSYEAFFREKNIELIIPNNVY